MSAASASQLVINADFRVVQPGETVQFAVRITLTVVDSTITVTVNAAVRVNGHTVATLDGDAETARPTRSSTSTMR